MAKKSNLQLMEEAERIVSTRYQDALLVAADGKPSSGTAIVADDYNEWLFIFQFLNKNESVSILCLNETFDPPQHHPHPVIDVMHESLPRTLSLDGAISSIRRAGFNNAFKSVSLFKSTLPGITEASYVFTPVFLLVGATSGTVWEEL